MPALPTYLQPDNASVFHLPAESGDDTDHIANNRNAYANATNHNSSRHWREELIEQPEALRLADWLDGSSNGPLDARHKAAVELRRLHEANEAFASRQTWWNNRTFELENALRKAVKALSNFDSQKRLNAIAAAKQALGKQT